MCDWMIITFMQSSTSSQRTFDQERRVACLQCLLQRRHQGAASARLPGRNAAATPHGRPVRPACKAEQQQQQICIRHATAARPVPPGQMAKPGGDAAHSLTQEHTGKHPAELGCACARARRLRDSPGPGAQAQHAGEGRRRQHPAALGCRARSQGGALP